MCERSVDRCLSNVKLSWHHSVVGRSLIHRSESASSPIERDHTREHMCGGHIASARPLPPPLSLHSAGEAFPEFDCSFCSASPPERYPFLFRHALFLLALSLAVSLSGWPAYDVGVESAHPLQCRVSPCHSSSPVPSSLWVPPFFFISFHSLSLNAPIPYRWFR